MPSRFIHHVDTATTLHKLRGMFKRIFGCLKSLFWTKLSCKATSIPTIIGSVLAQIRFIFYFDEGWPLFVEAAWDYQNLQNIR